MRWNRDNAASFTTPGFVVRPGALSQQSIAMEQLRPAAASLQNVVPVGCANDETETSAASLGCASDGTEKGVASPCYPGGSC